MTPEEVPDELVERAAQAIHKARCLPNCRVQRPHTEENQARHALAAVLPEIQAQALRDEADRTHTYHFSTGDRVEPVYSERARHLLHERAARLAAVTEGPTDV